MVTLDIAKGVSLNAFGEAASHDSTHQRPPFSQARHSFPHLSLIFFLVHIYYSSLSLRSSVSSFTLLIITSFLLYRPREFSLAISSPNTHPIASLLDDIMALKRSAPQTLSLSTIYHSIYTDNTHSLSTCFDVMPILYSNLVIS